MNKKFFKTSVSGRIFDFANLLFMLLFCVTIIFPVWNLIVISFSTADDVAYLNLNLWPKQFVTDAYKYCLQNSKIYTAFFVSIARTIVGTAYHLLICVLAAYGLMQKDMPFVKIFTFIFLIPMFFSGGLIPTYINIRNLKLLDNFFVYVLPMGFSMYNIIIVRNYFLSIDGALQEAARIDGASEFRILSQIIVPLSTPVLATVTLWQMVAQWNSWFDNLIYVRSESLLTAQFLLRKLVTDVDLFAADANVYALQQQYLMQYNPETIKAATTVLVVLPIILTYPFLQKYFVKGIMLGAVKG